MKSNTATSNKLDRPKILLFRFLAHQLNPFAYAVNTFLRPALDDCQRLLHDHPQVTCNTLLTLAKTFLSFAPESELIYQDVQEFARQLKHTIDESFLWVNPDTLEKSSESLESIHQNLSLIIEQENKSKKTDAFNMHKTILDLLANFEKIDSLPAELQSVLTNNNLNGTIPVQVTTDEQRMETISNGHLGKNSTELDNISSKQLMLESNPLPSYKSLLEEKTHSTSKHALPSAVNRLEVSPVILTQSKQDVFASQMTTSATTKLTSGIKNTLVNSIPVSTIFNTAIDPVNQSSSEPMTKVLNHDTYDKADAIISSSLETIHTSILPSHHVSTIVPMHENSQTYMTSGNICSSSKSIFSYEETNDTPVPMLLNDELIQPIMTPNEQMTGEIYSTHQDESGNDANLQYYLNPWSESGNLISSYPARHYLSTILEQSVLNFTTAMSHMHVTDGYMREFGNDFNPPDLRGDLCMTYGTPQNSLETTCLPIGVGLSYDELTLLSCDVHRSSRNVRLYDVETGRLKHVIGSTQQMKLHRPNAVMSNSRNQILIVEREHIYVIEPDGRLIAKLGHPSIRQLYGIALLEDRCIVTIDSKTSDSDNVENSRILMFDSNAGALIFEQEIAVNRTPDSVLKQKSINHVKGNILSDMATRPRFLAGQFDNIYISDLGRSLIYGMSIRNGRNFHCTTVFGGQGRANGEVSDPSGLLIDSGGNVLSADSKNDRIQMFTCDGFHKTTLKLNERIKRPSGICANRNGTKLYISCYLAGCVRAFNLTY